MAKKFSVSLAAIMKELGLEPICLPAKPEELEVSCSDVNRPGLALSGYYDYFDSDRIQVLGKSEHGFLEDLAPELRSRRMDELAGHKPPAIVVSRSLEIFPELKTSCETHGVPLLRSPGYHIRFYGGADRFLECAAGSADHSPRRFVEVYGEGILLVGDSRVERVRPLLSWSSCGTG